MVEAVDITHKICRGIQYLHQQGIVHRNIEPRNVLLSFDLKTVKLCGFGSMAREHDVTEVYFAEGLEYTAPELMGSPLGEFYTECSNDPLDKYTDEFRDYCASKAEEMRRRFQCRKPNLKKCDVYSAAITFWELFHRRVPFKEDNILRYDDGRFKVSIAAWVTGGNRPNLVDSPLGETMMDLIQSAWHPDPDQRPSILEILEKLDDPFIANEPAAWHPDPDQRLLIFLDDLDDPFNAKESPKSSPIEPFLGEFTAGENEPMALALLGSEGLPIRTIIIRKAEKEGYFETCCKFDSGQEKVSVQWKPDNIEREGWRYWTEGKNLIRIKDGKLFCDELTEEGLTIHLELQKYCYSRT